MAEDEKKSTVPSVKDLKATHASYDKNIANWQYLDLAYNGGKDFIEKAIGDRNPRESQANFEDRRDGAYNWNYCKSIVDLFNFYLTEKPPVRDLKKTPLKDNVQWEMFKKDVDHNGTDLDVFMNEAHKLASAIGAVGILVTKPRSTAVSVKEEIDNRVYPYLSLYSLENILDWKFDRDPKSGRKRLCYLKLLEEDDQYLVWTLADWKIYKIENVNSQEMVRLVDQGTLPAHLDEIPFTWMTNTKDITRPQIGVSDIVDISKINASLVRNASSGEEIIKWAGFVMLRMPYGADAGGNDDEDEQGDGEVAVGDKSVLQFDPEFGENGKPDWMESEILEPIEAILKWMDRKIDEVFRVAHLSGVHGQRKSNNEVASGLALRYEFQQLVAVLSKKSDSLSEAERNIVRFWMKWQNLSYDEAAVTIKRTKDFSIDDLSISLKNLRDGMKTVVSAKFRIAAQKATARKVMPDISQADQSEIDDEIDAAGGKIEFLEAGEMPVEYDDDPDDDKEVKKKRYRSK